jgi:hypothetical protein
MKTILFTLMLLVSSESYAAMAFWTGRQVQVQTVTYQYGWNCEYNYNGQIFWKIFINGCQSSVDIY